MRLKTSVGTGLILWTGHSDTIQMSTDFLALAIRNGYLHLRYNLGSGEAYLLYNLSRIDDGNWHRIKVTRYSFFDVIFLILRTMSLSII